MNVKKNLENRIRGFLPKEANLIEQNAMNQKIAVSKIAKLRLIGSCIILIYLAVVLIMVYGDIISKDVFLPFMFLMLILLILYFIGRHYEKIEQRMKTKF
jgi:hypothetical protein